MKIVGRAILTTALLLTACAGSSGDLAGGTVGAEVNGKTSASEGTKIEASKEASNEVKILKNGTSLVSYSARSPAAALVEEELMIGLDSPDGKVNFIVYVGGASPGAYPLGVEQGAGKAWIHLMSDALPRPSFDTEKGELKLTELSDKYCSGTLTASRTESNGDRYKIEASFSKIPVRKR